MTDWDASLRSRQDDGQGAALTPRFMRQSVSAATAAWMFFLSELSGRRLTGRRRPSLYGPISPARRNHRTFPNSTAGLLSLLVRSWTGEIMSDGVACPSLHDAWRSSMSRSIPGRLIIAQPRAAAGVPYVNKPSITFAGNAAGGTTNIIFNVKKAGRKHGPLAGTIRNQCRRRHAPGHLDYQ